MDEPLDAGVLSEEERDDLMQTDVAVQGRLRTSGEEVYLVVEVSWGFGREDLERGFAKLGWRTVPVLAGSWVTPEAREAAHLEGACVVLDGGVAVDIYSPETT